MDCIFCKIVNNEIPCQKVYEDENVLAFFDISPVVKTHILIIPKIHIENALEINKENSFVLSKIYEAISIIAKEQNLLEGFRVISNTGLHGGQSVNHLHFHLIGGQKLKPQII